MSPAASDSSILRPRDLAWQQCLAHEVQIDPSPPTCSATDAYGNKSYFHVQCATFRVTAISVIELSSQGWLPNRWRVPGSRPGRVSGPTCRTPGRRRHLRSPYVDIPPAIEAYARGVPSGRPIGEAATDLMHRVYADFT